MKALIRKASDDSWYQTKEVNTIEDLFSIYNCIVVQKGNDYKKWPKEDFLDFWDDTMTDEDCQNIVDCEITVLIYDSYIE